MHACLIYISHGVAAQIDCYFESQRFSSVLNSLQYDLILLTGDYPLIDFTLLGRYINVVQVTAVTQALTSPCLSPDPSYQADEGVCRHKITRGFSEECV